MGPRELDEGLAVLSRFPAWLVVVLLALLLGVLALLGEPGTETGSVPIDPSKHD